MDAQEGGIVTSSHVTEFARGHQRNPAAYTDFSDDNRHWFRIKRNWESNAANDGVCHLMDIKRVKPDENTEARRLYDAQNNYFYNVLQINVKGGKALVILRKYQDEQDGATVYQELIDHYEHKSNKSLIKAKCTEELVGLKLTPKFPVGPKKFFLQLQNVCLDLENAAESTISNEVKSGMLNAALQDPRFAATRTSEELLLTTSKCLP